MARSQRDHRVGIEVVATAAGVVEIRRRIAGGHEQQPRTGSMAMLDQVAPPPLSVLPLQVAAAASPGRGTMSNAHTSAPVLASNA